MTFVMIADVTEIPAGKMKRFEAGDRELLIANVGGEFFAVADRCPHMSARLSMGLLNGRVVTCPLHFSRFDVTTGRKVSGPAEPVADGGAECLPEARRAAGLTAVIRTGDLQTFPVKIAGGRILADV